MDTSETIVQLGFAEDDGLGELLVERLLAGSLTVLWEPLDLLAPDEVAAMRDGVGDLLTVVDSDGEPACNVRVQDTFETTWGDPDPRLVRGEGYGTDVEAWRGFVATALAAGFADEGLELTDEAVLVVQEVVVVDRAED